MGNRVPQAWLEITGSDAYEKYQSYGRGKAKLMHIRMKELLDGFPGDPPEYLVKAVEQQARKLGGQWGQEFTEVDLSATFSGTTIRRMAIDTGLKELYDHVYRHRAQSPTASGRRSRTMSWSAA